MSDPTLPLVRNCILISTGTIGVVVNGKGVLIDNQFDASTNISVNAAAIAYVLNVEDVTYGGAGTVEPLSGDRSVWDALGYQARHANDIDEAAGVHHTLGTGADQAAAGNHTHVVSPGSITLANTHILVGNGSNVAADVAMSGDATIANTGALTLKNTGPGATGPIGDSTHVAAVTIDAQGRVTALSSVAITTGHTIQDEGATLPTETNLNFVGSGVIASDDAGNNATRVTIEAAISVYNETIVADGASLTYYLVNYAAPGTIRSYIDGIRQPISDDDDPTDAVTFSSVPALGALLLFDYEMDI